MLLKKGPQGPFFYVQDVLYVADAWMRRSDDGLQDYCS